MPKNDDSGASADDDLAPPSSTSSPTSTTRQIEISTGEALCFGVYAFRPYKDPLNMVRLIACVGDEVLLYGIPLVGPAEPSFDADGEERKEEAIFLGKTNVGKGYGANVATYTLLLKQFTPPSGGPQQQQSFQPPKELDYIAVGCENGIVVTYQLNPSSSAGDNGTPQYEFTKVAECQGHTKAVCAIQFHPRGTHVLSSAKDGTARVFDTETGSEMAVLKCEVHDPKGPAPVLPDPSKMKTKDPRMMKRAPQILVRGCAYGDLEGKSIYTVASGKRGPAYLTKWKFGGMKGGGPPGGPPGAPVQQSTPTDQRLSFNQQFRIECSPVPVSATSFSADGTLVVLGSVNGSISLYHLESQSVLKKFDEVHDLPVTCVASRPIPNVLLLPGELEGGVNFDAVSASADNRLGRFTLQKKSRIQKSKPPRSARKKSVFEVYLWEILRVPLYVLLLLTIAAIRDTVDICKQEFGLSALVMDGGVPAAGHCLYREVLWAEESRVSFVPE